METRFTRAFMQDWWCSSTSLSLMPGADTFDYFNNIYYYFYSRKGSRTIALLFAEMVKKTFKQMMMIFVQYCPP